MLKIPKLVLPLDLSGYSPELKGETLHVWVDPPRRLRQEYDELLLEVQQEEIQRIGADLKPDTAPNEKFTFQSFLARARALLGARKNSIERGAGMDVRILKWYFTIWAQGPEDSALPLEDIQRIEDENPAFLGWLIGETWRMIRDNQTRLKKN